MMIGGPCAATLEAVAAFNTYKNNYVKGAIVYGANDGSVILKKKEKRKRWSVLTREREKKEKDTVARRVVVSGQDERIACVRESGAVDVYTIMEQASNKKSERVCSTSMRAEEAIWLGEEMLIVASRSGVLRALDAQPGKRYALLWERHIFERDNYHVQSLSVSSGSRCILVLGANADTGATALALLHVDNEAAIANNGDNANSDMADTLSSHSVSPIDNNASCSSTTRPNIEIGDAVGDDDDDDDTRIVSASLCPDVPVPLFFAQRSGGVVDMYRRPMVMDTSCVATSTSAQTQPFARHEKCERVRRAIRFACGMRATMAWLPRRVASKTNAYSSDDPMNAQATVGSVTWRRSVVAMSPRWGVILRTDEHASTMSTAKLVIVRGWDGMLAMNVQVLLSINADGLPPSVPERSPPPSPRRRPSSPQIFDTSDGIGEQQVRLRCLSARWNIPCENEYGSALLPSSSSSSSSSSSMAGMREPDSTGSIDNESNRQRSEILVSSATQASANDVVLCRFSAHVDDEAHLDVAMSMNHIIDNRHHNAGSTQSVDVNCDTYSDTYVDGSRPVVVFGTKDGNGGGVGSRNLRACDVRGHDNEHRALLSTTADVSIATLTGHRARIDQICAGYDMIEGRAVLYSRAEDGTVIANSFISGDTDGNERDACATVVATEIQYMCTSSSRWWNTSADTSTETPSLVSSHVVVCFGIDGSVHLSSSPLSHASTPHFVRARGSWRHREDSDESILDARVLRVTDEDVRVAVTIHCATSNSRKVLLVTVLFMHNLRTEEVGDEKGEAMRGGPRLMTSVCRLPSSTMLCALFAPTDIDSQIQDSSSSKASTASLDLRFATIDQNTLSVWQLHAAAAATAAGDEGEFIASCIGNVDVRNSDGGGAGGSGSNNGTAEDECVLHAAVSTAWVRVALMVVASTNAPRDRRSHADSGILRLKIFEAESQCSSPRGAVDPHLSSSCEMLQYANEAVVDVSDSETIVCRKSTDSVHLEWIEKPGGHVPTLLVLCNSNLLIVSAECDDSSTRIAWSIVKHLRLADCLTEGASIFAARERRDGDAVDDDVSRPMFTGMQWLAGGQVAIASAHHLHGIHLDFDLHQAAAGVDNVGTETEYDAALLHLKRGDVSRAVECVSRKQCSGNVRCAASLSSTYGNGYNDNGIIHDTNGGSGDAVPATMAVMDWPSSRADVHREGNESNPLPPNFERILDIAADCVGAREVVMDYAAQRVLANIITGDRTHEEPSVGVSVPTEEHHGRGFASADEIVAFVMLSKTKPAIVDSLRTYFGAKSGNSAAVGMGTSMAGSDWALYKMAAGAYWMDSNKLRSALEALAKTQFATKKDPMDCALLYTILGKIAILKGLFRVKRQDTMVKFLERDFRLQENRVAAVKNAYVLLGQRRFELAATFFLLGGAVLDAVNIMVKNLHDIHLAVAVVRLLGIPRSPTQNDHEPNAAVGAIGGYESTNSTGAGGKTDDLATFIDDHLLPTSLDNKCTWRAAMLYIFRGRAIEAVSLLLCEETTTRAHSSAIGADALLDFVMALADFDIDAARSLVGDDQLAMALSRARTWYEMRGAPELALEVCDGVVSSYMSSLHTDGESRSNQSVVTTASGGVASSVLLNVISRLVDVLLHGKLHRLSLRTCTSGNDECAHESAHVIIDELVSSLPVRFHCISDGLVRQRTALALRAHRADERKLRDREASAAETHAHAELLQLRNPQQQLREPMATADNAKVYPSSLSVHPSESRVASGGHTQQKTADTADKGDVDGENQSVSSTLPLVAHPILSMQGESMFGICACARGEHIAVATKNHGIVDASVLGENHVDPRDFLNDTALRMIMRPETSIAGKDTFSRALSAHPYDYFYASGSMHGDVLLWRFGSPNGEPENALTAMPTAFDTTASSRLSGRASDHSVAAASWSLSGSRIACIARNGCAALLSPDACCDQSARHTLPLMGGSRIFSKSSFSLPSTMSSQLLPASSSASAWPSPSWGSLTASSGSGIIFLGTSSTTVVCVGESNSGINMQVIDALAPPRSARVLCCACHDSGGATCVVTLDGFQVATGGRHGGIMMHDIRMMGSEGPPLWSLPRVHSGAVDAMSFTNVMPGHPALLASGGADGDIHFTCLDGSEYCSLSHAHTPGSTKPRTGGPGSGALAAITGLTDTGTGLLVCGGDGNVKQVSFRSP